MILTPDQQAFLDNIKSKDDTQVGAKRALIKDKMYLWPKAKVYYNFDKGVGKFITVQLGTVNIVSQTVKFNFSTHNPFNVQVVLISN